MVKGNEKRYLESKVKDVIPPNRVANGYLTKISLEREGDIQLYSAFNKTEDKAQETYRKFKEYMENGDLVKAGFIVTDDGWRNLSKKGGDWDVEVVDEEVSEKELKMEYIRKAVETKRLCEELTGDNASEIFEKLQIPYFYWKKRRGGN